ncbi:head GIN domain-containing protein [Maribacter sp. 2304DJ31-5]|uniref:head GIN domain-containing protein n=1 Tax=Maribacter sp. 2304DJ31-5 TaxID=3386273 RepID=UPI0039BD6E06
MKTKSVIFIFLLSVIFTSCEKETIRVSGEVTTVEYNLSGYNSLKVFDDFNVVVNFSETEESILVEANADLQEKIVVKKDGDRLVIKLENNINVRGNAIMNIYITTATIADFRAAGDVNIVLDDVLIARNARIALFGDSDFEGPLEVDNLDVELRGDSDMVVYGTATNVIADVHGDSDFRDFDLSVENLDIDLRGDSDAFLTVTESIKIRATGDSSLSYRGNARVLKEKLSGDSRLISL